MPSDETEDNRSIWSKLIGIAITIVIVVAGAYFINNVILGDKSTDYVETVRQLAPFEWDGETATIRDVVARFFDVSTWSVRTESDELTFVDLQGIIRDVDGRRLNIVLTYRVTPVEGRAGDAYWIEPIVLEINNRFFGEDAAIDFQDDLFGAFSGGYDSLADYFLSMGYTQGILQTFIIYY